MPAKKKLNKRGIAKLNNKIGNIIYEILLDGEKLKAFKAICRRRAKPSKQLKKLMREKSVLERKTKRKNK